MTSKWGREWHHWCHRSLLALLHALLCPSCNRYRSRHPELSYGARHALLVARDLLYNLPSSAALPSAMRQWRDNVDHLLNWA
jgi:hypothetical protein